MTTFQFMQNAFFLLCGIVCIAATALIVYCVIIAVIRAFKWRGRNGRNQD